MGLGKTQMAFNLMARDDVEVFYVPCSKKEWAFTDRYDAFNDCAAKDMLEQPGRFGDSRKASVASISKQPRMYMYGFIWALVSGVSVFTGPRTRDEVVDALKTWRLKSRGKCCVFFLDNFPCRQHYEYECADHISVSDMIWDVEQEHGGNSAMDPTLSCVRPDLRVIIKKSRPLFAKKALEYVQANPLEDDTDLTTYMDNMAGKLVKRDIFEMTTRATNEFYGAQYSVFFNSSYSRTRGGVRIFDHYECLSGETKPFKLWIYQRHVVSSKGSSNWNDWFVVLNRFPLPEEDALLHLSMTGGKGVSAFLDCTSNPQASYYEAREFASRCSSLNPSSDDDVTQEAEVCGALVVASRHNGFAGSSFPSFFSRLLYEVEMQKSSEVQVRFPNEVLGFLSCLTVPFLAPSDVKWPAFLLQMPLNLGTLSRLTRKDKVDVKFMDGKVTAESLSPNASLPKSSLMRVLKTFPNTSAVHLVVIHSLQSRYLNSRKRDENGNVVVEDFQRKHLPKSLRSAHFYRIGVQLSPKETDAAGKLWRNDLKEVRGLSNEDIEGGVAKVVIFVEVDRSKKEQMRKRKWQMKQQLEAEKKRERETKQELEANAEKKRKLY
ncbi:hypothetical protein PF007_g19774 [Phytophthora fragariae]|uniref:Uncharacterized protein n=2 Tax=Phytophthora fragariae TaxID=53985 RepID=A0A6A3R426_9STRA|nr:hypothetical protein PF007_g19774 [Phytophthora fragariae]KAE9202162.1 hypothetical protein PF004_g18502 [Phytophthora fragariae]